MKKNFLSFYSEYTDQEPLLERKWFTVDKNVSQRLDKDLSPGSFASEQGFNLRNWGAS